MNVYKTLFALSVQIALIIFKLLNLIKCSWFIVFVPLLILGIISSFNVFRIALTLPRNTEALSTIHERYSS